VTLCDCAWASAHSKTTSPTATVRTARDMNPIIRFSRRSEADRRATQQGYRDAAIDCV